MESVIVAICCFVFLIILTIVFFTKPKMNKLENKTFSWLLILNIIGLLLQVFCMTHCPHPVLSMNF